MTDAELLTYMGLPVDHPNAVKFITTMPPEKRASYERMHSLEGEIAVWQAGLGPKPSGVLLDMEKDTKRRRAWR